MRREALVGVALLVGALALAALYAVVVYRVRSKELAYVEAYSACASRCGASGSPERSGTRAPGRCDEGCRRAARASVGSPWSPF